MPDASTHILLVEDSPALSRVYEEFLAIEGHRVTRVASVKDAIDSLTNMAPDAVVLDLQLPDASGLEVLRHMRNERLAASVVVVTANGSINAAVEAMREGAFDFIVKPVSAERLIYTLRNAIERQRLSRIVETYRASDRDRFCGFIGSSLPMQAVYRTIESAARSKASIFVTGESGTGKEVCAEAIHRTSPRSASPLVAINCAAIPHELMESEIFGHVRGAFTGATADRTGAARRADGGTLFLDEICEMPLDLQVKLLRFIQTGTLTPVGGHSLEQVDVRFVCATNRDPALEVREGRFREDLYYRLHVIPIALPPLRERSRDILLLARQFLGQFVAEEGKSFAGFDRLAEHTLESFSWPGNVRQLQNVIRNVVVLNDADSVTSQMLDAALLAQGQAQGQGAGVPAMLEPCENPMAVEPSLNGGRLAIRPLAEIERAAIELALQEAKNNVTKAAAMLEISPSTIYRKVARWGGDVELLAAE